MWQHLDKDGVEKTLKPDLAATSVNLINVKKYGAIGNGAADDTTAIVNAMADMGTGKRLVFPDGGTYRCSASLSFNSTTNQGIVVEPGGVLMFTGTGAGNFITAFSSTRFTIEGSVQYNNAGFTGILINLDKIQPNNSNPDTSFPTIRGADGSVAILGGSGTSGAAAILALNGMIIGRFENILMQNAAVGIRGRKTADDYSNVVSFENITFVQMTSSASKNAGSSWRFDTCTFEQLQSGAPGAYTYDSGLENETSAFASAASGGLTFDSCWFGDGNLTGTWITWAGGTNSFDSSRGGGGLVITGCEFESASIAIRLGKASVVSSGIVIKGNRFNWNHQAIKLDGDVINFDPSGNEYRPASTTNPQEDYGTKIVDLVYQQVAASVNTTSTSYVDLTGGPTWTCPAAGWYEISYGATGSNSTGAAFYSPNIAGTASDNDALRFDGASTGSANAAIRRYLSAGNVVKMQYKIAVAGTANYENRSMNIRKIA